MRKILFKSSIAFVFAASLVANNSPYLVFAQEETQDQNVQTSPEVINLVTGEVRSIETKGLNRVAVANPDTVDISDAKPDSVIIAGKKPGQTSFFVWDSAGKHDYIVRVASENLDLIKARVEDVINKAQIKGISLEENPYEGKVVLYGSVPKTDKDALEKVMDPYSDKIINLVKSEVIDDLVQIDMQVTELSTTLTKQLGLDWSAGGSSSGASAVGSTGNTTNTTNATGSGLNLSYKESGLPGKGSNKIFNVASFGRTTPITVAVNALIQEGKGRILSNPRLVVMSGKEATFLVGGEVPIRTTTVNSTGGQSQDNVSYKQYGVNMTITPTIRGGKVDIVLNVHISDIDKSTTDSAGDVGYITRQAQTQLFLDDKQTIVLAGFIKHAEGETVSGIPFLSKVPVFGAMFRTRNSANPNSETEMVISLTPTILRTKKIATEQVVFPSKRVIGLTNEVQESFDKEPLSRPEQIMQTIQTMPEPKKSMEVVEQTKTVVTTTSSRVIDSTVLGYMRSVQLRISKSITYPFQALQSNWYGTSKIRLRILRDGTLADCDLLESSGHDLFDLDAINTAKMVAPYLPFPPQMKQEDLVITVPIVYNKKSIYNKDAQTTSVVY